MAVYPNWIRFAAFLRRPPLRGVSCRYRTLHGFTLAVNGSCYGQGDCPKERFRAMTYLHMGHRLDNVVSSERDREVSRRQGVEGRESP